LRRLPLAAIKKNDTRMKISTILILMIVSVNCLFGQLAIINDKDGFVNIRKYKSSNSEIISRVFDGDIFMVAADNENDEWWDVFYSVKLDGIEKYKRDYYQINGLVKDNELYIQGFIHKSRFILIEKLGYISPKFVTRTANSLSIKNDSVDFKFQVSNFNYSKHQIGNDEKGNIEKIDNINPRGVDNSIPKIEIAKISLSINNQTVDFPKYMYQDLFEPNLDSIKLHYDLKGNWILSMPYNSDGAGGYFAAWLINKNVIKRRYVDSL
jgi:hypothetical protein